MELYKTVGRLCSAEQIIERSRFIATVKPVESREEADAFLWEIKQRYKDATHNVPAMVLGHKGEVRWASDDGEPQGTAGAPMLQVISGSGLTNLVMVVTRYFGGTKLGTGGLVRAYSSSARLVLEKAGIASVSEMFLMRCAMDYRSFNRLSSMEIPFITAMEDVEYGEQVVFTLVLPPEQEREAEKLLLDLSSGKGEIIHRKTTLHIDKKTKV